MATSHTEGSSASVARPDLYLINEEWMRSFGTGEGSVYTILRSAALFPDPTLRKSTLNFEYADMYREDSSAAYLPRAPGSPFRILALGTGYEVDITPGDRGGALPVSWANQEIRAMLAQGMSRDDILAQRGRRSYTRLVEEIELLGTEPSGAGLGDATTPFVTADSDPGNWASDSSNPVYDVDGRRNVMRELGVTIDTMYCSWTVLSRLRVHPALVSLYGGNVGYGGLGEAQVAAALGLQRIYAGNPDRYGAYVTLCRQPAPGTNVLMDGASSATVIWCYDPSDAGEYGVRYTTETMPGTHGRDESVLASAYGAIAINPAGGCRLSGVLT